MAQFPLLLFPFVGSPLPPLYPLLLMYLAPSSCVRTVLPSLRLLVNWPHLPHPSPNPPLPSKSPESQLPSSCYPEQYPYYKEKRIDNHLDELQKNFKGQFNNKERAYKFFKFQRHMSNLDLFNYATSGHLVWWDGLFKGLPQTLAWKSSTDYPDLLSNFVSCSNFCQGRTHRPLASFPLILKELSQSLIRKLQVVPYLEPQIHPHELCIVADWEFVIK
jgi:hypothetical protein